MLCIRLGVATQCCIGNISYTHVKHVVTLVETSVGLCTQMFTVLLSTNVSTRDDRCKRRVQRTSPIPSFAEITTSLSPLFNGTCLLTMNVVMCLCCCRISAFNAHTANFRHCTQCSFAENYKDILLCK